MSSTTKLRTFCFPKLKWLTEISRTATAFEHYGLGLRPAELSSLYRAMQQQAFYFISRKYVHDVQQK
ncbi:hypothetical protein NQ318_011729 [Aromia moschata]|uniref:Uncharacterized protein n=1 Tax=Aromia moschata TaxID=1265417 RepID=A0AAV8XU34_9CUCU|nr:hypothetical protein NQ318_011729 [Aromia moschata]